MDTRNVSLDIMEFVEQNILPKYAAFDKAHNLSHANSVIKIMREAVEDHRASASHAPRSIYGKIVAEADRDLRPETVFRRTVLYGLAHYPEKSEEEQWKRFVDHMENKYSAHGYIKLWIQNSPNQEALRVIREIIVDKTLLRKEFDKYFGEETI